jgi:hypothetical protein
MNLFLTSIKANLKANIIMLCVCPHNSSLQILNKKIRAYPTNKIIFKIKNSSNNLIPKKMKIIYFYRKSKKSEKRL